LRAPASRIFPVCEVGAQRLVLALDLQRRLRLDLEHAAHVAPGVLADAQAAARRGLLEASCGDVDGEAADRAFFIDTAAVHHQHTEGLQRRVRDVVHVFGVDSLAERGRVDHIEEQHTHLAAPRHGALVYRQLAAQRRERRIDHRAAERRALRFERDHCPAQGVVLRFGIVHPTPPVAVPKCANEGAAN
jgi:hypothetical protein